MLSLSKFEVPHPLLRQAQDEDVIRIRGTRL
jgi:hypothetical protein